MARSLQRPGALTGAAFAVLLVISFLVGGETPGVKDPIQDIVSHYAENDSKLMFSSILSALSVVFFLFFLGSLGAVLQAAEGATPRLSAVARAGGVVAAVGMLIFAGLVFTLGDASDHLDPAAIQALNALSIDLFFPLAGGMVTFLLATGLLAVRTRALPPWLGWAALVIAVASFTPLGFFAFLASVAWVFAASIFLALRGAASSGAS